MSAVALARPIDFARRSPQGLRPRGGAGDRAAAADPLSQHGDLASREELAERFLPLARDLALRYTYTDEPFDDLLPGREPRPDQGDRPLRARPRHEVHELRRADDPRRAQAPLPRQGLGAARAARPAGADARGQPRDRGAVQGARPLAQGPRGCRRARLQRREGARGSGGGGELRGRVARRADGARRRRGRAAGRLHGRRGHLLRARGEPRRDREHLAGAARRRASGGRAALHRTTSRSARSASGSATPRCTCRACCAGRSTRLETAAAAA